MKWYEWIFDGIGTIIISSICSIITYKAAVKQISYQYQTARDNSKQRQNSTIVVNDKNKNKESITKQVQKAKANASQLQYGKIKHEK